MDLREGEKGTKDARKNILDLLTSNVLALEEITSSMLDLAKNHQKSKKEAIDYLAEQGIRTVTILMLWNY